MIRVATLEEFDPKFMQSLCKVLYQAFAVGSEHAGQVVAPGGVGEPADPHKLLAGLPAVRAFADDRVLYLTVRKLAPRKVLGSELPTFGVAQYNGQRALVSASHIKSVNENVKVVARYALQELGHTWGVHHCLDPRCAMYPHWTPSYLTGDAIFCTFCREQTDQKVSLAKS
jgi:archaemetzincin